MACARQLLLYVGELLGEIVHSQVGQDAVEVSFPLGEGTRAVSQPSTPSGAAAEVLGPVVMFVVVFPPRVTALR
ncbi:MAG: hypothetical protein LH624_04610 [Cryobacterium sp.]|nr:hypothetical protein [Cryobacterium sp.]